MTLQLKTWHNLRQFEFADEISFFLKKNKHAFNVKILLYISWFHSLQWATLWEVPPVLPTRTIASSLSASWRTQQAKELRGKSVWASDCQATRPVVWRLSASTLSPTPAPSSPTYHWNKRIFKCLISIWTVS